jgi:hypothetical protein
MFLIPKRKREKKGNKDDLCDIAVRKLMKGNRDERTANKTCSTHMFNCPRSL